MSFVHRSIRRAVLSAPSQKDKIIALAFRADSIVLSVADQEMASGILVWSSETSIFIVDCIERKGNGFMMPAAALHKILSVNWSANTRPAVVRLLCDRYTDCVHLN